MEVYYMGKSNIDQSTASLPLGLYVNLRGK